MRRTHVPLAIATALFAPHTALAQAPLVVQGTTDVRDAGLLDEVIVPEFQRRFPQYQLRFIAVGTGQALANARAGQGDAVLTHAPTLESQFVRDGFSLEPRRRAVFYSDYVILGQPADPAGVRMARNDVVSAFERIRAAGDRGQLTFVSRGDNSGTNVQEKEIWRLSNVPKNNLGEPGPPGTTGSFPWYRKAGLGQAATVQLAEQCPFASGSCYEMTDRGTYNRLRRLRAISRLQVLAEKNRAGTRGGEFLLINAFSAYAVNPARVPSMNRQGALDFINFLQSPPFQQRVRDYPERSNPAFCPDARPLILAGRALAPPARALCRDAQTPVRAARPPRRLARGDLVTIRGSVVPRLPGDRATIRAQVRLQSGRRVLDRTRSGRGGRFRLTARLRRSATLSLVVPNYDGVSGFPSVPPTDRLGEQLGLGRVTVR
ncbi:MAG: substrate-binding domain-containing protein [Thermoleophilaceae bacterium]|nr:substrate-binding domain-containing protein [Thermoleophilaceae bacterium]